MLKRNFPYLEHCKNLALELVLICLFEAFTLPEKTVDIFMTLFVDVFHFFLTVSVIMFKFVDFTNQPLLSIAFIF